MSDDEARVTVRGVPDQPGAVELIFSKMAARSIALDMIVQNEAAEGRADMSFTVDQRTCPPRCGRWSEAPAELGARGVRPQPERLEDFRGRPRHGHPPRRGRHDVPRPGRKGDQHPDDLHQPDQDLGGGGAGVRRRGPPRGPRGVPAAGPHGRPRRPSPAPRGHAAPPRRRHAGRPAATHGRPDHRGDRVGPVPGADHRFPTCPTSPA